MDDEQHSYEDLIKIQTILLDSYSSDSNQSIALSLSQSVKIAATPKVVAVTGSSTTIFCPVLGSISQPNQSSASNA